MGEGEGLANQNHRNRISINKTFCVFLTIRRGFRSNYKMNKKVDLQLNYVGTNDSTHDGRFGFCWQNINNNNNNNQTR